MNEMTHKEKDFIKNKLRNQSVNIKESDNDLVITKKEKKKKKYVIGYKNPKMWVAFFLLLPIILVGLFVLMLSYTKSFLGDGFNYFMNNKTDETIQYLAQQSGFEWIPIFMNVYDYRYVYILVTFILFFGVAILIMYLDYRHSVDYKNYKKEKEVEDNNDNSLSKDSSNIDEYDNDDVLPGTVNRR